MSRDPSPRPLSPAVQRDVADRLSAAKLWLVTTSADSRCGDLPYLASVLYALHAVPTGRVQRMSVDQYWRLYVNPQWALGSEIPAVAGQLAHLAWHLIATHAERAIDLGVDSTTSDDWRRATDATIADLLTGIPSGLTGADGLGLDPGRSAEEYFARLSRLPTPHPSSTPRATTGQAGFPQGSPAQPGSRSHGAFPGEGTAEPGCGSGCDGKARGYELPPTADLGAISQSAAHDIRRRVLIEYREHQARAGTMPGEWQRWVGQALDPVVPWTQVLAASIRRGVGWAHGHVDYTYSKLSRRHSAARGVLLPATRRPIPEIAIVQDTSSSVDDGLLAQALGEIDGVLAGMGVGGSSVTVLATDAITQATARVLKAADAPLPGGGGTDMSAGIEQALRLRPSPSLVIVITDGFTPWPQTPPPIPVVIALLGRERTALPSTPGWAQRVECMPDP